ARTVVLRSCGKRRWLAESEVWNSSSSWTSIERVIASSAGRNGIRTAPRAGGASSRARPTTRAAIAAGPAAIIAPPARSCGAGGCRRSRSRRLDDPCHDRDQLVAVDRLRDVHLKAGRQRLPPVLEARAVRQCDRGDRAAMLRLLHADAADERVAVLAWHADVGQEAVRPPRRDLGEQRGGRPARPHLGAGLPQDRYEAVARVRLVVDPPDAEATERGELPAR